MVFFLFPRPDNVAYGLVCLPWYVKMVEITLLSGQWAHMCSLGIWSQEKGVELSLWEALYVCLVLIGPFESCFQPPLFFFFSCMVNHGSPAQIPILALCLPSDAGSLHYDLFDFHIFCHLYFSPWTQVTDCKTLLPELRWGLRIFAKQCPESSHQMTRFIMRIKTYLLSLHLAQTLIFICSLDLLIDLFFPLS